MISPHTPPGTEVVALVTTPGLHRDDATLVRGQVYTVARIWTTAPQEAQRYCVDLVEHGERYRIDPRPSWKLWGRPRRRGVGYSLHAFRYLEKAATPEFYATKEPRRVEKKAGVPDHALRGLRAYYAGLVEESRPRACAALRRAAEVVGR